MKAFNEAPRCQGPRPTLSVAAPPPANAAASAPGGARPPASRGSSTSTPADSQRPPRPTAPLRAPRAPARRMRPPRAARGSRRTPRADSMRPPGPSGRVSPQHRCVASCASDVEAPRCSPARVAPAAPRPRTPFSVAIGCQEPRSRGIAFVLALNRVIQGAPTYGAPGVRAARRRSTAGCTVTAALMRTLMFCALALTACMAQPRPSRLVLGPEQSWIEIAM
jgi:hypothetical protein